MDTAKNDHQDKQSLTTIISTAIQIPGVKVNREIFLREQFKEASSEQINIIIERGPIEAHYSKKELRDMAHKLLNKRALFSTGASFIAGMPGGLAMAATIPGDMLQFYAVALRLAQEVCYLYGEDDLWSGNIPDDDKITNQLILYCGVMLGATGAAQTVRVLSSSLAKQALKKLPQKALTKTFYYPVVKSIAKAFGVKMTKGVFAKGISKAIPVIGGVVSGGITFATFPPMGARLIDAFEKAKFTYTDEEFNEDWITIVKVCEEENEVSVDQIDEQVETETKIEENSVSIMDKIREVKVMLDTGIINEDEFLKIKAKLIAEM